MTKPVEIDAYMPNRNWMKRRRGSNDGYHLKKDAECMKNKFEHGEECIHNECGNEFVLLPTKKNIALLDRFISGDRVTYAWCIMSMDKKGVDNGR